MTPALERFGRFLFELDAPLTAALFRIAFCTALLVSRLAVIPDVAVFYSGEGVVPNTLLSSQQSDGRWSLLHLIDAPAAVIVMHWLFIGAILMVLVGSFTRTASIALFLLVVSFRHRNPMVANAGDQMATIAAFWLMFLDAGHSWSVDARRAASARRWGGSCALRALQLQLCFAYAFSCLHKLTDPDWRAGTAMFYVIADVRQWTWPIASLLDHRWFCVGVAGLTLLFEATFPALVWWRRTRTAMVAVGIAFHTSIAVLMGIPFFSLYMIALLLVFVRPRSRAE